MPFTERSFALKLFANLLIRIVIGQFIRKSCFPDRQFAGWLLRKLWASSFAKSVTCVNFFLCFWSESAFDEVDLHRTIRLYSKIRSQNVHFHDSFWREQTLAATKLFLSLTHIDFAVAVSSRALRISSRAVHVFPALSLRRVRPSYGTFSLMVFQRNCARGRTGHMIINNYSMSARWMRW